MPTIRYTDSYASVEDSAQKGETRQVTGEQAQAAVRGGYAEIVRDTPAQTPESAAAPLETAAQTSRRKPRRGGEVDAGAPAGDAG